MSMDSIRSNFVLPRFDGKNFSLWKLKAKAALIALDLFDVVNSEPLISSSSSSTISTTNTNNKLKALTAHSELEVQRKASQAYYHLINALGDEQIRLIIHIPEGAAHLLWSTLIERYERKTMASKSHTRELLHNSKQGKNSVDYYISQLMELEFTLKSLGSEIGKEEMIFILFKGLRKEYDAIVQTLRLNENLEFEDACQHLRDHEEIINLRNNKTIDDEIIGQGKLYSAVVSSKSKSYPDCRICGRSNHHVNKCFVKQKLYCSKCNQLGHTSYTCDDQESECDTDNSNNNPKATTQHKF
jgi:hypothetical protein